MDTNFVNNIIPRLRTFANNIAFEEALVDKIWVIYDDPDNLHDYQFLRDNRLIMTHNGDVQIGHWEILPGRRLLINRGSQGPINLLFDFSIYGLVIMKKVGNNESPFILFDNNVVPDGNIIGYLDELENNRLAQRNLQSNNQTRYSNSPYKKGDLTRGIVATLIVLLLIILFALM